MSRALEEKDAAISAITKEITKIRDYLATKQQVSSYTICNNYYARLIQ
jgi:hypothetical protein